MKWKKAQYQGQSSFGKKFLIFLIITFILIGGSYYFDFMNTRNMTKKLFTSGKEKVNDVMSSDIGSSKSKFQPHTPEVDLSWCNAQNIPVDTSETSPESIQVLGANLVDVCCLREYKGFNSCLNTSVSFQICFSSQLGGEIKWSKVNEKFVNSYYYQKIIKDIHKSYNPNFRPVNCDLVIYN